MKSHLRRTHENHRSFLLPWEKALPVYKKHPDKAQSKALSVISQSTPKGDENISARPPDWFFDRVRPEDFSAIESREKLKLAALWFREALFEKETILQLNAMMQDLMLRSAPVALIRSCARAVLDEIEHQRLCVTLVNAFSTPEISFRESSHGHASFATDKEISAQLVTENASVQTFSASVHPWKDEYFDLAWKALEQGVLVQELSGRFSIHLSREKTYCTVVAELLKKSIDEQRHSDLYWDIFVWALKKLGRDCVNRLWSKWSNLAKPRFEAALLGDGKCRDYYREVRHDISDRLKRFFELEWGFVIGENNQLEKALPISRPAS